MASSAAHAARCPHCSCKYAVGLRLKRKRKKHHRPSPPWTNSRGCRGRHQERRLSSLVSRVPSPTRPRDSRVWAGSQAPRSLAGEVAVVISLSPSHGFAVAVGVRQAGKGARRLSKLQRTTVLVPVLCSCAAAAGLGEWKKDSALGLQSYLYFLLLGWAESYYLGSVTQDSTLELGKINPWVCRYGYTRNIPVSTNPMGMSLFPLTNLWV